MARQNSELLRPPEPSKSKICRNILLNPYLWRPNLPSLSIPLQQVYTLSIGHSCIKTVRPIWPRVEPLYFISWLNQVWGGLMIYHIPAPSHSILISLCSRLDFKLSIIYLYMIMIPYSSLAHALVYLQLRGKTLSCDRREDISRLATVMLNPLFLGTW